MQLWLCLHFKVKNMIPEPPQNRRCLDLNAKILYYFGVWPVENEPMNLRFYWRRYLHRVQIVRGIYSVVFNVISTYLVWGTLHRMIEFTCAIILYVAALVRFGSIYFHRRSVKKMCNTFENLYAPAMLGDDEYLKRTAEETERFAHRFSMFVFSTTAGLCVVNQVNLIVDGFTTRTLPFRLWLPYDYSYTPVFEITVLTMNTLVFLDTAMTVYPSILFLSFTIHLIGQYQLLRYKIEKIRIHVEMKVKNEEPKSTCILIEDDDNHCSGVECSIVPLKGTTLDESKCRDGQNGIVEHTDAQMRPNENGIRRWNRVKRVVNLQEISALQYSQTTASVCEEIFGPQPNASEENSRATGWRRIHELIKVNKIVRSIWLKSRAKSAEKQSRPNPSEQESKGNFLHWVRVRRVVRGDKITPVEEVNTRSMESKSDDETSLSTSNEQTRNGENVHWQRIRELVKAKKITTITCAECNPTDSENSHVNNKEVLRWLRVRSLLKQNSILPRKQSGDDKKRDKEIFGKSLNAAEENVETSRMQFARKMMEENKTSPSKVVDSENQEEIKSSTNLEENIQDKPTSHWHTARQLMKDKQCSPNKSLETHLKVGDIFGSSLDEMHKKKPVSCWTRARQLLDENKIVPTDDVVSKVEETGQQITINQYSEGYIYWERARQLIEENKIAPAENDAANHEHGIDLDCDGPEYNREILRWHRARELVRVHRSEGNLSGGDEVGSTAVQTTVGRGKQRWRQMKDKIIHIRDVAEELRMRTHTEMERYLKHCAQHHQTILSLTKDVERVFNQTLQFQSFLNAMTGLVALYVTTLAPRFSVQVVTTCMLLAGINGEFFFQCWFGNIITDESERLREAVYGCEWYGASESFKRSLRIMISRTNKPEVIRGGGLSLSMKSFRFVCRTGYYLHRVMVKIIRGVKLNDKNHH